jgi:hypothetical protein
VQRLNIDEKTAASLAGKYVRCSGTEEEAWGTVVETVGPVVDSEGTVDQDMTAVRFAVVHLLAGELKNVSTIEIVASDYYGGEEIMDFVAVSLIPGGPSELVVRIVAHEEGVEGRNRHYGFERSGALSLGEHLGVTESSIRRWEDFDGDGRLDFARVAFSAPAPSCGPADVVEQRFLVPVLGTTKGFVQQGPGVRSVLKRWCSEFEIGEGDWQPLLCAAYLELDVTPIAAAARRYCTGLPRSSLRCEALCSPSFRAAIHKFSTLGPSNVTPSAR